MRRIDLNADLGEQMGDDKAMLGLVTSANIACGGHAGDPEVMYATLSLARERGVVVGAHPSYPDREGFGRRRLGHAPAEVERFVAAQVGSLIAIAALAGTRVAYVKPHGALANVATTDAAIAGAIVRAVAAVDRGLAVLAISGTVLENVAREGGLKAYSEIFADRGYTPDGNLVPRGQPGAMIDGETEAADRLVKFIGTGLMPTVDGGANSLAANSICIHGDSPHAVAMARRVRAALSDAGVTFAPFLDTRAR